MACSTAAPTPTNDNMDPYGYGTAVPDNSYYGYGDGAPDSAPQPEAATDYGYGDAAPDSCTSNKYGYGDAAPDTSSRNLIQHKQEIAEVRKVFNPMKAPRRSSLKQMSSVVHFPDHQEKKSNMTRPRGPQRRASIQFGVRMVMLDPVEAPKKVRRRTSITFQDTIEEIPKAPAAPVHSSADSDGITSDSTHDEWIQPEEYERIKKDNAKIVKYMTQGGTDKNFCVRGLEAKLESSSNHNKDMPRQAARRAVVEEQWFQRSQGIVDQARISEKYKMITLQAKIDAAERAEGDNSAIQGYVRKERKIHNKMMRRMSM